MFSVAEQQPLPDDWFADDETDEVAEARAARMIAFARRPYMFRRLENMNVASNDVLTSAEMKFLDALAELIIMNDRAGDYPAKEPQR